MKCPSCNSEEWKLASLVHKEGLQNINIQSNTFGVGIGSGGVGIGGGATQSGGQIQSIASQRAAPPQNPAASMLQGGGLIGGLVCGGISFLTSGFFSALLWIFIGTFIGGILGFIYACTGQVAHEHEEAVKLWQRIRMCTRCGTFYSPEE